MSNRAERPLPDDLLPMAERLRVERPGLDALALDLVRTRARARVSASQRTAGTHSKGAFLKSRLAITMILALGILMSLGGAGLAVSGLGDSGGAADVQYREDPRDPRASNDSNESNESTSTLSDPSDPSDPDDPGDPDDVKAAAQESSGDGDDLPFTGFAAIPVLIGGIALLGSGSVLRRRAGREDE